MATSSAWKLDDHPKLPKGKTIALIVLDGWGESAPDQYNCIHNAPTPAMDSLKHGAPDTWTLIKAHGTAVGLPSEDDMGNSEVGHNALGAGRIFAQGAKLCDQALASGKIFQGEGFKYVSESFETNTLHLVGLLSDGGVHSRLDQLQLLIKGSAERGAKRIRVHILTDGRDVLDGSSVGFVETLEADLVTLRENGVDAQIASGGGRMYVTLDRYENDWEVVKRGWDAQVLGEAPHKFKNAVEAVKTLRKEPGANDQYLPPFVIVDDSGKAVGPIVDGDAVVTFNFRADRMVMHAKALEYEDFDKFDRVRFPKIRYAGMLQYDGELKLPSRYLVSPPEIDRTSGEYLAHNGVSTFACSETVKFGHVTFFWNGNRSGYFNEKLEEYVEIPSDSGISFNVQPKMKALEIGEKARDAILSGKFDQVRVNIPNGDMVGHTGDIEATVVACEAADLAVKMIFDAIEQVKGIYVVTADHGNAEDMVKRDKSGKPALDKEGKLQILTSHTLKPVKVLHSWRQYTNNTGETLELVLADSQGVKIHASVKKDLVAKYVNSLQVNEWKFIEHFSLTHAAGQFRPTGHLYKMSFVNGTTVTRSDIVSDSSYLTLARFSRIQNGDLNPYMLIDVMGQVVNIGELEVLEANNKPTTKLDFELRDEHDDRMSCTLWGTFAEKMFQACQAADGIMVICVIRFAKIKAYKGVRSLSNSFDASQVHINPPFPEIEAFTRALPSDGLALTFRESVPKFQMVTVNKDDDCLQFERKTISDLFNSTEIGKARVICTIYGIDTDWAWYYFSCRNCNKKVTHIHSGVNTASMKKQKPRFWCDVCRNAVTNVVAKYMLYVKVMDNTGETKCLLFDSICSEIVGETAASLLGGSFNEIEDPNDLPDVIRNLVGKTFLFLLCVEKENIWDGKDSFKVSRILNKDGLLQEDVLEDSEQLVNPASIVSGDQCLMLTMSQDTSDSSTPSSKRVYAPNLSESEQSSSSKKVCIEPKDLQKSELEFGENGLSENGVPDKISEVVKVENVKIESNKGKGVQDNGDLSVTEKKDTKQVAKAVGVKIKQEKK